MMNIKTVLHPQQRTEVLRGLGNVPFGTLFTDHMFMMEWQEGKGWHDPRIVPYGLFPTDPALSALHYGSAIFEGMKAYRTKAGRVGVYRPKDHFTRLNTSATRMCMPTVDVNFVTEALCQLLRLDAAWVPADAGTALYIRPTMVATEANLNLKESASFLFFIVLSPVASLYGSGFKPVSIMVTEEFTRAAPGGTGAVKAAGNYAGAMLAQRQAKERGFAQVLWLDPVEHKYVEEVGAMNLFFVMNGKLVTPALTGTILPGITRRSILQLAAELGLEVQERRVTLDEVLAGLQDGSCSEVFGCGTAAVIAPVGKLGYRDQTYVVNNEQVGPVARQLFEYLTALHYGQRPDTRDWLQLV